MEAQANNTRFLITGLAILNILLIGWAIHTQTKLDNLEDFVVDNATFSLYHADKIAALENQCSDTALQIALMCSVCKE